MNITAEQFLDAIFQDREDSEHVCVSKGFKTDDGVGFWNVEPSEEPFTSRKDDEAWYFCVSTVGGERNTKGTALRRRTADVVAAHCLVLDDIGTKAKAPPVEPSWKLESSAGNFQWGYMLEPTVDFKRYEALVEWCHDQGWGDAGAGGCYRIMRVPGSCNIKEGRGMFKSVITHWDEDSYWSLDGLASDLGCEPEVLSEYADKAKGKSKRSVGGVQAMEGIDPVLDWLSDNGHVVSDNGEWVDIICPWHESHTSGGDTAGYSPLGRGDGDWVQNRAFKCLHEHCKDRKLKDFREWVDDRDGPPVVGFDPLPWLQSSYVYVVEGQTVCDMVQRPHGGTWQYTKDEWADMHPQKIMARGHEKAVMLKTAFIESPDTIKARAFAYVPGGGATTERNRQLVVNTYVEPNWAETVIEPEVFLEHVAYVVPDVDERELFLDWLAFKIQNPAKRSYAVVMVAEDAYGTGRSTLKTFLKGALQGKVNNASLPQLIGKGTSAEQTYNDWGAECQFIVVEEAKDNMEGADFYNGYETFKQNIDTTPSDFRCNPKFGKTRTDYRYYNALIFSNHADALVLPENDRRVLVLQNPTKRKSFDYYDRLQKAANSPVEAARLYWHLKRRDVSKYDHVYPPMTKAKQNMINMTVAPSVEVEREVLMSFACDLATKDMVVNAVRKAANSLSHDAIASHPGGVGGHIWKRLERPLPDDRHGFRVSVEGKQKEVRIFKNNKKWLANGLLHDKVSVFRGLGLS